MLTDEINEIIAVDKGWKVLYELMFLIDDALAVRLQQIS